MQAALCRGGTEDIITPLLLCCVQAALCRVGTEDIITPHATLMLAALCRGGTEDIINQESTRAGNFCDISSRNRIFITLLNNLKSSRTNWRYIGISSINHFAVFFSWIQV